MSTSTIIRPLAVPDAEPAVGRRPWVARLCRAIDLDAFVLHFQPIVSIADGSIAHHEALLRLTDVPGQLIAPNEFLPAAERYGLIGEIDRMVVRRVCEHLASEDGRRGGRIAINVSALSITEPALLEHLKRCLEDYAIDPQLLVVEITETAAVTDMDAAAAFCAAVLELGCEVALDDFGSGFGSFDYLRRLPFSLLKIDGSLIRNLPVSRTDQLIVKALSWIVRGMGAEAVAEGVGDEQTVDILREYKVGYAQGFYLGRPESTLAV